MTNHTGTVTFLMYEAATGKIHELNSMGTLVPDLPAFRRVPPGTGFVAMLPGRIVDDSRALPSGAVTSVANAIGIMPAIMARLVIKMGRIRSFTP